MYPANLLNLAEIGAGFTKMASCWICLNQSLKSVSSPVWKVSINSSVAPEAHCTEAEESNIQCKTLNAVKQRIRWEHGVFTQEERWAVVLLKYQLCQFLAFCSIVPLYNREKQNNLIKQNYNGHKFSQQKLFFPISYAITQASVQCKLESKPSSN